jgi:hypothetical protein
MQFNDLQHVTLSFSHSDTEQIVHLWRQRYEVMYHLGLLLATQLSEDSVLEPRTHV